MEVIKGRAVVTLYYQITRGLAARISGLYYADSRESLGYQTRAPPLLKLYSGKFTQTAAARTKVKSGTMTCSYDLRYFRG